jgi:hypothetical protein
MSVVKGAGKRIASPAIVKLRKRLRPKRRFYKTLHRIGLNDSTVRMWFRTTRRADDLIDMLDFARVWLN